MAAALRQRAGSRRRGRLFRSVLSGVSYTVQFARQRRDVPFRWAHRTEPGPGIFPQKVYEPRAGRICCERADFAGRDSGEADCRGWFRFAGSYWRPNSYLRAGRGVDAERERSGTDWRRGGGRGDGNHGWEETRMTRG